MALQALRSGSSFSHGVALLTAPQIRAMIQQGIHKRLPVQTPPPPTRPLLRPLNIRPTPAKSSQVQPVSQNGVNSSVAPGFNSNFYLGLDLQQATRQQFGTQATLKLKGNHLYQWSAMLQGTTYSLDLQRATRQQYSSQHALVAVGAGAYDWKAIDFKAVGSVVLPVMIVPADKAYDNAGIQQALTNYRSNLLATQTWYHQQLGERFQMLDPIIVFAPQTAAQWNALAERNALTGATHKEALLRASTMIVENRYPGLPDNLKVVIAPYTGNSPDVWTGSMATGKFAVVAPRVTSVYTGSLDKMDARSTDAVYALAHELGHTFGLDHPQDPSSIMQTARPPQARLLPTELAHLRQSSFFA